MWTLIRKSHLRILEKNVFKVCLVKTRNIFISIFALVKGKHCWTSAALLVSYLQGHIWATRWSWLPRARELVPFLSSTQRHQGIIITCFTCVAQGLQGPKYFTLYPERMFGRVACESLDTAKVPPQPHDPLINGMYSRMREVLRKSDAPSLFRSGITFYVTFSLFFSSISFLPCIY